MKTRSLVRWRVVGLIAACAAVAHAQTAPPLKPGLWQVNSERTIDGQKAPDLGEHLKTMPPEMRKRMEANMKQHGVDMSGGAGNMKICHTRESLERGQWQGENTHCKTEFSSRSGSTWKWRSTCDKPMASVTDGEATFTNAENYTVKTTTTATRQGKPMNSQMLVKAKWLGADCGDLKPISPPASGARPAAKP